MQNKKTHASLSLLFRFIVNLNSACKLPRVDTAHCESFRLNLTNPLLNKISLGSKRKKEGRTVGKEES